MRLVVMLAALIVAVLPASAAEDAARAENLDRLFVELKQAPSLEAGKAVERQIMATWLQSGDAEIDRRMRAALAAIETGALDTALAELDGIVAMKPDFAEGWNKRATLHFLMGDYEASVADIAETLKREPRHFAALSGLGMVMLRLNNPTAALDALKRAVAIDPNLDEVQAIIRQLEAGTGQGI